MKMFKRFEETIEYFMLFMLISSFFSSWIVLELLERILKGVLNYV